MPKGLNGWTLRRIEKEQTEVAEQLEQTWQAPVFRGLERKFNLNWLANAQVQIAEQIIREAGV